MARIVAGSGSRSSTQCAPKKALRYTQPVPAVWNTGETTRTACSGRMVHGTGRERFPSMLRTGIMAPLGMPVVPDV